MAMKDQRIHQNRKRNNQNRPTNNLIVDEYDGETLSHDKANAETSKVHIISDLDMKKTTNKFFWYQECFMNTNTQKIIWCNANYVRKNNIFSTNNFVGEVAKF